MNTGLVIFLLVLAVVIVIALETTRREWRCIQCGKAGGPMFGGTVDEPLCRRCARRPPEPPDHRPVD